MNRRRGGRLIVVDMREHEREEYRSDMGHVWLGFSPDQVEDMARRAGFERVDTQALPPEPGAKGPLLFVASLRNGGWEGGR
ncbi:MAG: hypothetical protein ACREL7_15260 [Longimicrobiales bacterium]